MLQPKRTKFRKMMKGRNRGLSHRGSKVDFGEFGLKALSRGRLTARQIEAARRAMTLKALTKVWRGKRFSWQLQSFHLRLLLLNGR